MVYLTQRQTMQPQRMFVSSIIAEKDENGNVVPDMYRIELSMANDLEGRVVNPVLNSNGDDSASVYSKEELIELAKNLDIDFDGSNINDLEEALYRDNYVFDAELLTVSDPAKGRLSYHIDTTRVKESEQPFDYNAHLKNTSALNQEYMRMTQDPNSVLYAVNKLRLSDYVSSSKANDLESIFYAERAFRNGDATYADARPLDVVNRLSDKITVKSSDFTMFRVFSSNEAKQINENKVPFEKALEDEGITLTEANYEPPVEEREHDPYAAVDIDYSNAPEIEYLEPEIPSDEEMARLEGREDEYLERERLHHEDDEIPVASKQEVAEEKSEEEVEPEPLPRGEDGLLEETGDLEPFDRKDKRVFIDGVPVKVVTGQSGETRYNIPLTMANDKLDPLSAYVKPKLNTANQWYGQNDMDRIANVTHVPVDYVMEDFDKKALSADLTRTEKGEYRMNTRTLKHVDDFDYDKHVEVTKETQSLYELWGNALNSTGKALKATAKDAMFRAYQLKERFGEWRHNIKDEYDEWSLHQEGRQKTKLKDKVLNLKEDLSAWSRGQDESQGFKTRSERYKQTKTTSKFMSKLEAAYWNRAQSIANKFGFSSKEINTPDRSTPSKQNDYDLGL